MLYVRAMQQKSALTIFNNVPQILVMFVVYFMGSSICFYIRCIITTNVVPNALLCFCGATWM